MPVHSPKLRQYTKKFVRDYLVSIPSSDEMQEGYERVAAGEKAKSTRELDLRAERFADYVLARIGNVGEITDSLLREALLATASDDQPPK